MKLFIAILLISGPAFADGKYPHAGKVVMSAEEQEAYDNHIDDEMQDLCFNASMIVQQQDAIKNEKEIGKQTGFVDAGVLHNAALTIIKLRKEGTPIWRSIKNETGKDPKNFSCGDMGSDEGQE